MDRTDAELLRLLTLDPRATYRDLADHLHVSIQAVHRRIVNLRKAHVITGFTANPSMGYLGAVRAHVVGRSECASPEELSAALRGNDSVATTLLSSGNIVHVSGLLRGLADLEAFADFAKRAARVPEARVAIETPDPRTARRTGQEYTPLSGLDMRIVRSLHRDARKSAADVASELGVSAVTVRRRLDRMIQERAIEFAETNIDPTFSGNVAALLSVTLMPGTEKARVGARLLEKHWPALVYFLTFLNLPDFLVLAAWTGTVAELKAVVDAVAKDEAVKSAMCNVALAGFVFETWRDKLVEAAKPIPPGSG